MNVYESPEYRALYAACSANYAEASGWLAVRDYLLDAGESEATAAEAEPLRHLNPWDVASLMVGFGSGSGSGRGSGIGIGSGSGSGSGIGSGIGSGRGRGIGIGSGRGSGSGSGIGIGNYHEVFQMEPGKVYLLHCGDWHTIVGRCVKQTGPMTYLFTSVSKIHDTNAGDNWEALAAGNAEARAACDYRHYTTPATVPLSILAFEWLGETPQESGL